MTVNGYFALNFVFVPVSLAQTVQVSENYCMKTDEDRHMVSAAQIFGRDSGFWQYTGCADIRSDSLERRR